MSKQVFTFGQFMKNPSLENTFKFLGDNPNSAVWVACAIAAFKGVFRPVFTMMDKESDPETKKYAAIREGLTELIAIPVYIAVPLVLGKSIINSFYKKSSEVTKKAVNANVKFAAVLASTAIIPALCNVIQPPIMEAYKKSQNEKKAIVQNNNIPTAAAVSKPTFTGNRYNYGMRVGS